VDASANKTDFTAHGTYDVFVYGHDNVIFCLKFQSPTALRRMLNGPRSLTPKLTNLPKNAGRCAVRLMVEIHSGSRALDVV
jgi:hypothetical protein